MTGITGVALGGSRVCARERVAPTQILVCRDGVGGAQRVPGGEEGRPVYPLIPWRPDPLIVVVGGSGCGVCARELVARAQGSEFNVTTLLKQLF